jgi:hypothetical protein
VGGHSSCVDVDDAVCHSSFVICLEMSLWVGGGHSNYVYLCVNKCCCMSIFISHILNIRSLLLVPVAAMLP